MPKVVASNSMEQPTFKLRLRQLKPVIYQSVEHHKPLPQYVPTWVCHNKMKFVPKEGWESTIPINSYLNTLTFQIEDIAWKYLTRLKKSIRMSFIQSFSLWNDRYQLPLCRDPNPVTLAHKFMLFKSRVERQGKLFKYSQVLGKSSKVDIIWKNPYLIIGWLRLESGGGPLRSFFKGWEWSMVSIQDPWYPGFQPRGARFLVEFK